MNGGREREIEMEGEVEFRATSKPHQGRKYFFFSFSSYTFRLWSMMTRSIQPNNKFDCRPSSFLGCASWILPSSSSFTYFFFVAPGWASSPESRSTLRHNVSGGVRTTTRALQEGREPSVRFEQVLALIRISGSREDVISWVWWVHQVIFLSRFITTATLHIAIASSPNRWRVTRIAFFSFLSREFICRDFKLKFSFNFLFFYQFQYSHHTVTPILRSWSGTSGESPVKI